MPIIHPSSRVHAPPGSAGTDMSDNSASRHLTRLFIVLICGLILGAVMRPVLGDLYRSYQRRTNTPPPMSEYLYQSRSAQFKRLDPLVAPGGIVYLGDSITALANLNEYFQSDTNHIVDRSIGGDTTLGVLERVTETFPADASLVVILLGVNDLIQGADAPITAERLTRICMLLLEKYAVGHIVLESVTQSPAVEPGVIARLNELLKDLATGNPRISFLGLQLADNDDDIEGSNFCVDGVHFTDLGCLRRFGQEVAHIRKIAPEIDIRLRVEE
jgi:GDSL-like Lipase/Acylhydrolase family